MKRAICVTIDEDSIETLDNHSEALQISRSTLVDVAVKHYINTDLHANRGMRQMWDSLYNVSDQGADMEDACLHMGEAAQEYEAQFLRMSSTG